MSLSIKQKQNYLYVGMIILTLLGAIISYRVFQRKWILYREAENRFKEEKFEEAIPLYEESIAAGLTRSTTTFRLADSYVAIGNFPDAIKWYRIYLEDHPNDVAARLALARVLSWNGNIKESEQEYQKVLERQYNEMDQAP